jgi:hypothetical protein
MKCEGPCVASDQTATTFDAHALLLFHCLAPLNVKRAT